MGEFVIGNGYGFLYLLCPRVTCRSGYKFTGFVVECAEKVIKP